MRKVNDISQEELKMLDDIDKNCIKMHVCPPPKTFITFDVYKDGKQISQYKTRSKSWVRNAYNIVASQMLGLASEYFGTGLNYEAGSLRLKSSGGSISSDISYLARIKSPGPYSGWLGNSGVDTSGIVVGSGTAAESFDGATTGHALETKISNGTGSGELSYVEQDATTGNYDSGTLKYTSEMIRYFNNNSGASINVNEVGIYVFVYYTSSAGTRVMLCRDKLASTVTVPDTGQLKVTYTMEMTFPS